MVQTPPSCDSWSCLANATGLTAAGKCLWASDVSDCAQAAGQALMLGLSAEGDTPDPEFDAAADEASPATPVPSQLIRGQKFEKEALAELGLSKNTNSVSGGSIPDAVESGEIWEFKDVKYQTMSTQFRNYFATGDVVNLVVNPDTVVSNPLQGAIFRSGGEILVREAPGVYDGYQG